MKDHTKNHVLDAQSANFVSVLINLPDKKSMNHLGYVFSSSVFGCFGKLGLEATG